MAISEFETMARTLAGYTKTCVISFIDLYKKVERNFPEARTVSQKDRLAIGKELIQIAGQYGMTVKPCAEGSELAAYGADCSGCMTVETFETALHASLDVPKKNQNVKNPQCGVCLPRTLEPMIPAGICAGTAMPIPMRRWYGKTGESTIRILHF